MSTYIELKNVSKTIRQKKILNQINISFQEGKVYGFKGHNGSGKTMLFRSICGLIIPTTGEVLIENKKIGKDISFPPSVGVLIEYPGFLPQHTGFKNLKMLASIKRQIEDEQIKNILEKVGLSFNDDRKFKKYSLGMKQRLGLAQAIMEDPDLIILDEPTNALDQEGIQLVKNIVNELKSQSKTILIASHDYEFLNDITDEIFTLNDGCIVGHEIND
ncbi:TPA: ATP-binding cassette domain-containing protein [Bacillus thuringiensis]|nr:ATP-binding cassette domain-containing protein [Bacillus thuringiensis]